jgi:hypothetical protein
MRSFFRWMVAFGVGLSCQAWGEPTTGTVGFTLYWNYLIVATGSAGPMKGLNFLVDTGASPSVLDRRVARRLHLEEEPASLRTIGGSAAAGRAVLPSLHFGPLYREQVPVSVEDLSFFAKALPVPIDGILGLDVLGQDAFLIDYRLHTIRFGPLPAMPGSLPLVLSDGLALVQAQVNGAAARLVLDTGAAALTMFTGKTASSAGAVRVIASPGPIGEVAHRDATIHSVFLGGAEFRRQTVSLVAENSPGMGLDGLLSPAGLGLSKIAVDLARREVCLIR